MPRKSLEERFWSKVDKRGPDECWEWTGAKSSHGYGVIWSGGGRSNGKLIKAHRVSWMLHNGPIPEFDPFDETCILHECDNPGCVNSSHLSLGTHKKNIRDAFSRNRVSLGERREDAVLTRDIVISSRNLQALGVEGAVLARIFGANEETIMAACRRISWAHVAEGASFRGRRRITSQDARQIKTLHSCGVSRKDLCAVFGVSNNSIGRAVNG